MRRFIQKNVAKIGPYIYGRSALPSAGSENLTFLSVPLPAYNPIGGGYQNERQLLTSTEMNLPRLVGIVGPGGYLTGQFSIPPLIDQG